MLRAIVFSFLATLSLGVPASASYELVTLDGKVREADSVQFAGEACIVIQGDSVERLESSQVDYYSTFWRNAESGEGNVIVFRTGAYFRFETVEVSRGRVVLGLGEPGRVTVPEQVVDFEQSVREAATIRLPREPARMDVAKKAPSSRAGSARGRSKAVPQGLSADRARNPRGAGGPAGGRLGGPGSSASRRAASLRSGQGSGTARRPMTDRSDPLSEQGGDGSAAEGSASPEGRPDSNGMSDPGAVRRRAEERGQASGSVSVIISSQDSADVAGVQFRLRYPITCSPAGAQSIGAFANASMAQPNGSVGGRPMLAMAIVYAADRTTSLPGQIARVDFTWTGAEPSPGEFLVTSASASDSHGNAVRGFRAEAQMLR